MRNHRSRLAVSGATICVMILWPVIALGQPQSNDDELPFTFSGTHWLDFATYLSVMGGVAQSAQIFTNSPWETWGPVIGARAGLRIPLGFRAELALTALPYSFATKPDSTKDGYTSLAARGRIGWGLWIDSVHLGIKVGAGFPIDTFDGTLGMEWHISTDNFFQCEFGIWSDFSGQICGYGWSF